MVLHRDVTAVWKVHDTAESKTIGQATVTVYRQVAGQGLGRGIVYPGMADVKEAVRVANVAHENHLHRRHLSALIYDPDLIVDCGNAWGRQRGALSGDFFRV